MTTATIPSRSSAYPVIGANPYAGYAPSSRSFVWGGRSTSLLANGLFLEAVLANPLAAQATGTKGGGRYSLGASDQSGLGERQLETFQQRRYGLKVEALKALRILWTRRADRLIVPSRYLARWVARWGFPTTRSTSSTTPSLPPPSMGESQGEINHDATVPLATPLKLVTVGRLVPLKRIDQVIEAVAPCDGVGLVIVGDGPERRAPGTVGLCVA